MKVPSLWLLVVVAVAATLACPAAAFAPTNVAVPSSQLGTTTTKRRHRALMLTAHLPPASFIISDDAVVVAQTDGCDETVAAVAPVASGSRSIRAPLVLSRMEMLAAGLSTGLVTFASCAMAAVAGEEIEMAELPPAWVPALFAVGLVVGVGVLTGSLGNVIDEEASLGLQSGARARKEIERSRSSYFKKR